MLVLRSLDPADPGYWTEDFEIFNALEEAKHFDTWSDLLTYVQLVGREGGTLYRMEPVYTMKPGPEA